METEGLHFIYRAIIPQSVPFVNRFCKFIFIFSAFFQKLQADRFALPRAAIFRPSASFRIPAYADMRQKERLFGTTSMSIGKITKIVSKNYGDFLSRSAFHEISRQKSSTLLIYKTARMRYNIVARRKQDVPSQVQLKSDFAEYQSHDIKRAKTPNVVLLRSSRTKLERARKRDRYLPIPFFLFPLSPTPLLDIAPPATVSPLSPRAPRITRVRPPSPACRRSAPLSHREVKFRHIFCTFFYKISRFFRVFSRFFRIIFGFFSRAFARFFVIFEKLYNNYIIIVNKP